MNSNVSFSANCLLTAPRPMDFINYQAVYQFKNGHQYLRAFNVLKNGKLLKRLDINYLYPVDNAYCEITALLQALFSDEPFKTTKVNKFKNPTTRAKKKVINEEARLKASENLFSTFGI